MITFVKQDGPIWLHEDAAWFRLFFKVENPLKSQECIVYGFFSRSNLDGKTLEGKRSVDTFIDSTKK